MLLNRQSYKVHFLVLFNKAIIIMQNQILYAFEESDCLECDLSQGRIFWGGAGGCAPPQNFLAPPRKIRNWRAYCKLLLL